MNLKDKILIITLVLVYNVISYGQVLLEPVCAETIEKYGVSGYPASEFVWSVEGGVVIEGDGTDTVLIQWGQNRGFYQIEVLEISSYDCYGAPSLAEIEVRVPYLDLGYEYPEMCSGDSLVFDAGEHYQAPYEITWHNGSNASEYIARSAEVIWARVIDGYGCIKQDTVYLRVHNLPEVNLGNDTVLCSDETLTIYAQDITNMGNYASSKWKIGNDSSYSMNYTLPGVDDFGDTLTVFITDINNCVNSDTLVILPCDFAKLFIGMPNSFTPDGDGINDTWNIPNMHLFENAELEVFDRWGRLVYRTKNIFDNPWDGKSKGRVLPMDSYYYVIDLKVGNAPPITGTVNLIR